MNPQWTIEPRATYAVRGAVLSLVLVGLAGCQELGPTPAAASNEAPAVTTLALPGDSADSWTLLKTEARTAYAATPLGDGSVLVCGGANGTLALNVTSCNQLSVDFGSMLPVSRSFPLLEGRIGGTLIRLPSNRILLTGGKDSSNKLRGALLSSPIGSWSNDQSFWEATEELPNPRTLHTATLLDSSVVLIGGEAGVQQVASIDVRSDQGVWSKVDVSGGLATRVGHTATVLKSGPGEPARVLVLGGYNQLGYLSSGFTFSLPNTITRIRDMPDARQGHTATLLDDGSVLVVGGEGGSGDLAFLATAFRYYPDKDEWVSAGSTTARKFHAAVRLGTGVIIAGGQSDEILPTDKGPIVLRGLDDGQPSANTVQRYDPLAKVWSTAPNLHRGRRDFQLLALDEAHLLAIGGNAGDVLESSEVFSAGALGQVRSDPNACVSGYVADGVCCDRKCSDPCHWCNDPSAPGVCQSVSGSAPNGNGCNNHLQCSNGTCPTQCTASSQCSAGFYCNGQGACVETKPLGAQCSTDGECPDGNPCVQGVCCESACSGSCEACNQSGRCVPLAKGELPREGNPPCPDAQDRACAASCDGTTRDRCAFPTSGAACAAAVCTKEGVFQPAGQCNGSGSCVTPAEAESCAPFACNESGCLATCTASSGCSNGNVCIDGVCTPACDDQACAAHGYRCDPDTHQCRNTCQKSETDCVGSYYCHPLQHECVKGVPFPAAALPACSISRPALRSRASLLVLAAALCAGLARRRRRTTRPRSF